MRSNAFKLITYGKDREEATERMIRAIEDYKVAGVETTLSLESM